MCIYKCGKESKRGSKGEAHFLDPFYMGVSFVEFQQHRKKKFFHIMYTSEGGMREDKGLDLSGMHTHSEREFFRHNIFAHNTIIISKYPRLSITLLE